MYLAEVDIQKTEWGMQKSTRKIEKQQVNFGQRRQDLAGYLIQSENVFIIDPFSEY